MPDIDKIDLGNTQIVILLINALTHDYNNRNERVFVQGLQTDRESIKMAISELKRRIGQR